MGEINTGRIGEEEEDLFPSATPLTGQGDPVDLVMDNDGVDSWEPPQEEEQHPYGGRGGGASGPAEDTGGDDRAPVGPFLITINGSTPSTDADGNPVYASSATIGVNAGSVIFNSSLSAPLSSASITGDFPASDGYKYYKAFGKVLLQRSNSEAPLDTVVGGSSSIVIEDASTNTFKEGWSFGDGLSAGNAYYMFKIGGIAFQRDGNSRWVHVSQIQVGDHTVGLMPNGAADANGTYLGDGWRTLKFCFNGKLYEGEVDVRNLREVTP